MCGIIGWIGSKINVSLAREMRDSLTHRGPDDLGEWWNPERGVWFGQRRLAIVDLSPEGHQPMISPSGRYILTYNGEVYNHQEIRRNLAELGFYFRGSSDTETILAAIDCWGLEIALQKFNGMFAFGLYDQQEHCLWLVRDRMGIKPLYYAEQNGEFAFASELRALTFLPWLNQEIDRDALYTYFRYLCVPAPASIFLGAKKLCQGTMLRWDRTGSKIFSYWNLGEVIEKGLDNPLTCSFTEAADELESLLRDAVKQRMLADVPLGAFLSGGVDSSLVVSLMQSVSSQPIKTFSIGFNELSFDESPYARAIAKHLGTEHHEKILTAVEVLERIPQIMALPDEPFADSSNIPTSLLCQFAREQVTVALSGDGGDELFGGYPRYFWASRIETWQKQLTPQVARCLGKGLKQIPAPFWDRIILPLGGTRFAGSEGLAYRVRRLGGYLGCPPERVYEEMVSAWSHPEDLLGYTGLHSLGPDVRISSRGVWAEQMMATDQANYLVDDILTKVDRASMAVALEVRVPLLDYRIVEWSWRVPLAYKLAEEGDRGKLLLREVLYRYVPRELIERPKMGFGMPLSQWIQNDLYNWANDLLNRPGFNFLDRKIINSILPHYSNSKNSIAPLWTILAFRQWQEASKNQATAKI